MNQILNFLQYYWMPIVWIVVAIFLVITWIIILRNKPSTLVSNEPDIDDTIKTTLIPFTLYLNYYLTKEFFYNTDIVYIKYYNELSPRRFIGYLIDKGLVIVSGLDDFNYKVYLVDEVFPCNEMDLVEGSWNKMDFDKDSEFYVVKAHKKESEKVLVSVD